MNETHIRYISKLIGRYLKKNDYGMMTAILTYHGVSETAMKNCITLSLFRDHLDYLSSNFMIISLSTMIKKLSRGDNFDSNFVVITFDDAYQNFLEFAYPELIKRKIPATLFIPAGLLGGYNSWDYDNGKEYPLLRIMNESDLKILDQNFIEIGSHSLTHRRMAILSDNELEMEIIKSKEILERQTGKEIKHFAYPFGELADFDERTFKYLKKANYSAAVTTHFGRDNRYSDIFKLKRISVWDDDTVADLIEKLSGSYDWLRWKEKWAFQIKRIIKF